MTVSVYACFHLCGSVSVLRACVCVHAFVCRSVCPSICLCVRRTKSFARKLKKFQVFRGTNSIKTTTHAMYRVVSLEPGVPLQFSTIRFACTIPLLCVDKLLLYFFLNKNNWWAHKLLVISSFWLVGLVVNSMVNRCLYGWSVGWSVSESLIGYGSDLLVSLNICPWGISSGHKNPAIECSDEKRWRFLACVYSCFQSSGIFAVSSSWDLYRALACTRVLVGRFGHLRVSALVNSWK